MPSLPAPPAVATARGQRPATPHIGTIIMFPSRFKLATYALVILLGFLMAAPNLFTAAQLAALPGWLPKQQITLGLDLKGGSHLVLQIDAATLERDHIDALADRALAALREANIRGATVLKSPQAVTVRIPDQARRADAERILRGLIGSVSAFAQPQPDLVVTALADGTFELRPTEAALIAKRSGAVEQSLEIVRRRLDGFGVAEPTIQGLGHGRILVQLPGVKD